MRCRKKDSRSLNFFIFLLWAFNIKVYTGIQTIELPLSAADDGKLTTFIQIGKVQEQMSININSGKIQVCCKNQNSIFHKIYYFLFNPFFQVYDYSCKEPNEKGLVNDSAKIANLGLIPVTFQQKEFPSCSKGILGLGNQSYFLSLLPLNLRSYTIFQNPSEYKKYTLKMGQDRTAIKEYAYFESLKKFNWAIEAENIKYNQVLLGSYPVVLNTDMNIICLPQKIYDFVTDQLISVYECKQIDSQLYCPCQTGETDRYPAFIFMLNGYFSLQIKPDNYLLHDSQICRVQIRETTKQHVQVNILFFEEYTFKFEPLRQRIGILKSLNDQNNHEKIKLPLQLILNCLVILLLCVFLALVLIEIIKRVSGLAEARDQIFRVDIRHKHQFHYASD